MFIRYFYNLFTTLAKPLLRRKLRQRAKAEPLYGERIPERFGDYAHSPSPEAGVMYWWLHAVSLGEMRAALPLIAAMRQAYPEWRLLLTNGTATGRAEGAKHVHAGDIQVWQPWDASAACRSFFARYQPCVGLVMETEVWPNLLAQAEAAKIPMALVNARLSEKSLRKAQRLGGLARAAYSRFDAVCAQTAEDAERLKILCAERNVSASHISVTGNMKFDVLSQPQLAQQGKALKQRLHLDEHTKIAMFASSRDGEEQMLLDALRVNKAAISASLLWMIVPRHPQRFDDVYALCEVAGYRVLRRSEMDSLDNVPDDLIPQKTIVLGDSMGEMPLYYSMADAVLLGGSFAPLGGQNLIEALHYGCPVIAGAHTFNFADAVAQAVQYGAAQQVEDMPQAVTTALQLSKQDDTLDGMRAQSAAFVAQHAGATEATMRVIKDVLAR